MTLDIEIAQLEAAIAEIEEQYAGTSALKNPPVCTRRLGLASRDRAASLSASSTGFRSPPAPVGGGVLS